MNVRSLTLVTVAALLSLGCDKIPFLNQMGDQAGQEESAQDTTPTTPAPAPDSAQVEDTPQPQPQPEPAAEPEPEPQPEPRPVARPVARQRSRQAQRSSNDTGEVPWTPSATGTVRPGMTVDEVVGEWGAPAVRRDIRNRTYLFYRNGCERACGTFDVVLLEDGQVVDAIVRGRGHNYAGVSSSPPDRVAEFTPPQFADTSGAIG
ncbi:MAG: hypothetical protein O7I93_11010 [Gemmatimonadetes bacterium]|nr:hypothetical protein [Gemmatimonadota bacterium]